MKKGTIQIDAEVFAKLKAENEQLKRDNQVAYGALGECDKKIKENEKNIRLLKGQLNSLKNKWEKDKTYFTSCPCPQCFECCCNDPDCSNRTSTGYHLVLMYGKDLVLMSDEHHIQFCAMFDKEFRERTCKVLWSCQSRMVAESIVTGFKLCVEWLAVE